MADIVKPDMSRLWANSGAQTQPADAVVDSGWQSGDIPPSQSFNYIDGRQDKAIAYILQKGIVEWDSVTEYVANKSFVQYAGKLYKAAVTNTNSQPAQGNANWQLIDFNKNINPLMFGAVGDGVTDDSAAFKLLESTSATCVDLVGKKYKITSSFVDITNGVNLRKDYINGRLIVDNRERIFDSTKNFALSGVSVSKMLEPSTIKSIGITKVDDNNLFVWKPLGGALWQRCGITRSATNVPFNWNETYIKQVYGYIAAQDSGVVYTGGWATTSGVSALSSADPAVYIGGRGRQSIAAGDYVEISYTGGGDLYVIFAGRTSGNYVNVLLDGKQDYLVLADDGAGNKYFDSYTSVDFQYKQIVKIAQSVPSGSHTIRLTVSSSKNPSSSGNRFIFNALSFDNNELGPWRKEADAIPWASGQVVLQNQVRKSDNKYYYATADGTTGATAPTHTSGTVSDGGVSWTYRVDSGYNLLDHRIQAAGSQLEYAYEIKPSGAVNKEDVGAALHGNETQTSYSIYVGGTKASLLNGEWRVGDSVQIVESLYSTHSEIGGGTTPVVVTSLSRTFKRQHVEVTHKHTLQMAAELGYFYPHMWPLLHYSSIGQKYGVRKLWTPGDGYRLCADFYGQSNPFVGKTKDLLMVATGDAMQPNGVSGTPSSATPPLSFMAWLSVDPDSVDYYKDASSLFATKAMNTSGADVSAGGFSSMTSKMYFERYSADNPVSLPNGYSFECRAIYGFCLVPYQGV